VDHGQRIRAPRDQPRPLRLPNAIVEQRFDIGAEALADPHMGRDAPNAVISQMVDPWIADAPLLDAIILLAEEDPVMHETWVDAIHEIGDMGGKFMLAQRGNTDADAEDVQMLGRVLAWMFERSAHQLTGDPDQRDAVIRALSEVVWCVFEYSREP
jgi:hypothetical protein